MNNECATKIMCADTICYELFYHVSLSGACELFLNIYRDIFSLALWGGGMSVCLSARYRTQLLTYETTFGVAGSLRRKENVLSKWSLYLYL